MQNTPVLALKIIPKVVGMYSRLPCYGFALNLFYLIIPGTRPLLMRKLNVFVYLYLIAKSEIDICSNKHETGLA